MLIRFLVGLTLIVSSLGCSREDAIRVAHVPQDWFNAPMILAIAGWPDQPPVTDVNTFSLASGLASKTAVSDGNAEVGLASPVVLLRDPVPGRVRILGCYMRSGAVLGIATRGSAIEEPIGYVANTISEVFLANYMIRTGRGDAYFSGSIPKIALLPPNAVAALRGAEANASVRSVSIWEPHLSRARREAQANIIRDPRAYTVHVCLIARRGVTEPQGAAIDRFAARVMRASAYLTSHPDQARALVESRVGLPSNSLRPIWRHVDFRYVSERSALEAILREEIRALQAARMLPNPPPLETLF